MAADAPIRVPVGLRVLAVVVGLTALGLCRWQILRDGERNAGREAALLVADSPLVTENVPVDEALAWRVVRWRGHYEGGPQLLAGRQEKSVLGYGVVHAFVREDGVRVLVDRGWIPVDDVGVQVGKLARSADDVLVGQLRPATGKNGATPLAGHGTAIWTASAWPSIQAATSTVGPFIVVAGGEDGRRTSGYPPLGGFQRAPERDQTSLHYAAQWLAIAAISATILVPGLLRRARQILGA